MFSEVRFAASVQTVYSDCAICVPSKDYIS